MNSLLKWIQLLARFPAKWNYFAEKESRQINKLEHVLVDEVMQLRRDMLRGCTMDETNPKTWRATLTPHRSLSPRGFVILMAVIAGLNFAAGLFFYLIGAWPVVGFMGLDVTLVWWAFRANFADGRRAEHIEITPHELVLRRLAEHKPDQEQRFARRWVRVELEEDRDRELVGGLYLRFRGKRTEIAGFLGAQERLAFARALKAALINPRI